MEDEVRILPFY